MRWILRILGGLVALIVVLALVGFFLPREVSVARSITVDAPPSEVFPLVNSMQRTEEWSPWLERDPNVRLTYEGPESGVGNKLSWASEVQNVGTGTQIITLSEEDKLVETALDFGEMGTAVARFELAAAGDGTQVTWGFTTDMGTNPVGRWMGLMMDGWIGADYEKGLANLKAVVEGG